MDSALHGPVNFTGPTKYFFDGITSVDLPVEPQAAFHAAENACVQSKRERNKERAETLLFEAGRYAPIASI